MDVELKEVKETIESKSSLGVTQMLSGKTHTFNVKGMQDFAKEGYASNPTVFSCIDLIGKAFSRIPIKVKDDKGEIVENSKLKKLMDRPNLNQGGVEFRYESIAWRLITGITFTERLMVGGMPSELVPLETIPDEHSGQSNSFDVSLPQEHGRP
jgi:phage portal protein BeeE